MDEVVMVTSIELSEQELAELRDLTEQSDSTEAIRVAMRDYIRYARRMRLKKLSGQVEMIDNWRQLEESEIGDHNDDFPT
jgi:metal-responsive CopG/Arc/MetJ family transcriptional regulator